VACDQQKASEYFATDESACKILRSRSSRQRCGEQAFEATSARSSYFPTDCAKVSSFSDSAGQGRAAVCERESHGTIRLTATAATSGLAANAPTIILLPHFEAMHA